MITGSLKNVKSGFELSLMFTRNGSDVRIIRSKAGNKAEEKLLKVPGKLPVFSGGLNSARGATVIFFNVFANNGPAIITTGMAIHIPYNKTFPISACSC